MIDSALFVLGASLATAALASPPSGWTTCGGLAPDYAHTACPSTQSCARQKWEPSDGAWGCCPFEGGTSCGDYTCCPAGTKCINQGSGWSVVSTCVPDAATTTGSSNVTGAQVCKTGPPIKYSSSTKNVMIVGDSVSIGYTPFVASVMADKALVQHSPWGGDGGAEETLYGARCIDNLVRAPDGTALSPDVLMFSE